MKFATFLPEFATNYLTNPTGYGIVGVAVTAGRKAADRPRLPYTATRLARGVYDRGRTRLTGVRQSSTAVP